jgi:predicted MPP superfamily phosphohydrolase
VSPPLEQVIARLREKSHYRDADYRLLESWFGAEFLRKRLTRQLQLYRRHHDGLGSAFRSRRRRLYRQLVRTGLWGMGVQGAARALARQPECVVREVFLPGLPAAFDGFRLLQLSDFHFDFIPEMPEILHRSLSGLQFDLCALSGDYRGETTGPYAESLEGLRRLRPSLGPEVYAVLGNHDNLEILLAFPDLKIHSLLNRGIWLERAGERLLLAGVDDPHYYRTHDFRPLAPLAAQAPAALLLAHSAECCREAAQAGFALQLSGHTHGGQLCLPGGRPLFTHLHGVPRAMARGAWRWGNLQGYTSRGVGSSSLDARLHCPPEITLHLLRRAESPSAS